MSVVILRTFAERLIPCCIRIRVGYAVVIRVQNIGVHTGTDGAAVGIERFIRGTAVEFILSDDTVVVGIVSFELFEPVRIFAKGSLGLFLRDVAVAIGIDVPKGWVIMMTFLPPGGWTAVIRIAATVVFPIGISVQRFIARRTVAVLVILGEDVAAVAFAARRGWTAVIRIAVAVVLPIGISVQRFIARRTVAVLVIFGKDVATVAFARWWVITFRLRMCVFMMLVHFFRAVESSIADTAMVVAFKLRFRFERLTALATIGEHMHADVALRFCLNISIGTAVGVDMMALFIPLRDALATLTTVPESFIAILRLH